MYRWPPLAFVAAWPKVIAPIRTPPMPLSPVLDKLSPAAEAYVWGYPLVAIQRTRLHLCSKTDTGTMNHIDNLATPKDRAIVVPNNDTLYSSAWYDLNYGDLTIEVPPMDHADRYWNVMILDAYGHVAYVCRRHHGIGGTSVRVTFDPSTPPANDNSHVATIGTATAGVIIRVLVESPEDIHKARSLQRAITVHAPASHPKQRTKRGGRATAIGKSGAGFYQELQDYLRLDPPATWHPTLSDAAREIAEDPASVPVTTLEMGVDEGELRIQSRNLGGMVIKNGWSTGRDATGFGGNIVKRAAGAKFGLGGHQAIENRSYSAQQDAAGKRLDGSRLLQLTFEANAMPPCSAFWSLTAYGTDMYLVENELDRWSISDRTPGLVYNPDGGLTIQLSARRPSQATNWLPVPSGPFLLGMRVYEGDDEVVDCRWFPPALVPQAV